MINIYYKSCPNKENFVDLLNFESSK